MRRDVAKKDHGHGAWRLLATIGLAAAAVFGDTADAASRDAKIGPKMLTCRYGRSCGVVGTFLLADRDRGHRVVFVGGGRTVPAQVTSWTDAGITFDTPLVPEGRYEVGLINHDRKWASNVVVAAVVRPQGLRDADGDGHVDRALGGDDCDDLDARRSPASREVCDADHVDEDCDPTTFGRRDADRDGFVDARCCNPSEKGGFHCGPDCDDGHASIVPGAQRCIDEYRVQVCEPMTVRAYGRGQEAPGPRWLGSSCSRGTCIIQPNGAGICG